MLDALVQNRAGRHRGLACCDVEDLAVKTLRAARDPSLRAAIGIRARATVAGHATPDIVARYEALLRAVAERAPAGAR